MALLFRTKICGITNLADGLSVAEAGGDALGFNFYPPSPRFVAPETARQIAAEIPPGICKVGVFVNASAAEIHELAARTGLDAVQLHGDEPPEILGELRAWPVIRAFRLGRTGMQHVAAFLARCRDLGTPPAAVLVDAFQPGAYGGTGTTVDVDLVRNLAGQLGDLPLILAGGLTPDNVAAAILAARPAAVDTASGVEVSPGRKDPERVRRFVAAAQAALTQIRAT